jgi:hypothetical protein
MPEILVTFMDGEVVAAESETVDFHHAVLNLTAVQPGDNNKEYIVPLTSIKYIVLGGEEEQPEESDEELGKVVLHFVDGEVIRAYAGKETLGGPHGIVYNLVDPERRVRRRIGVPYTSVKAIFKVKRWDSRGSSRGPSLTRLADILADREQHARASRVGRTSSHGRPTPLLDRTTRR